MDKYIERQNYASLVDQLTQGHVRGIAKCYTPVKISKLDQLVDSMNANGWEAGYAININERGREEVSLFWDAKSIT